MWGDMLSIVGGFMSTMGGYLEYRGGVQYRGEINVLLFEYPHGTHNIPYMYYNIPPRYLKVKSQGWYPPRY